MQQSFHFTSYERQRTFGFGIFLIFASFPRHYSTYATFNPLQSSHFEWFKWMLVNFWYLASSSPVFWLHIRAWKFPQCHQLLVSADCERVTKSATCHVSSHPSRSSPFYTRGSLHSHPNKPSRVVTDQRLCNQRRLESPLQQFNEYYYESIADTALFHIYGESVNKYLVNLMIFRLCSLLAMSRMHSVLSLLHIPARLWATLNPEM